MGGLRGRDKYYEGLKIGLSKSHMEGVKWKVSYGRSHEVSHFHNRTGYENCTIGWAAAPTA